MGLLLPEQFQELRERYDCSRKKWASFSRLARKVGPLGNRQTPPSRSISLLVRALYDGDLSINYLLSALAKHPLTNAQPHSICGTASRFKRKPRRSPAEINDMPQPDPKSLFRVT